MATSADSQPPPQGGGDIQRRDEGALAQDRMSALSPLRAFDWIDSVFPTRDLRSMIDTMDRMFDDPFFSPAAPSPARRRGGRVPWDFKESDDAYLMRLDMPGLDKEEVKVYVEEDSLVIKGEHSEEKKSSEDEWASRRHGSYFTRIMLPDTANPEQIKAELKNGVLNVTVPKVEEARKKNVIDVAVE